MEVTQNIHKCEGCKHADHTGAFTKGGTKPCCSHPVTLSQKGYSCFDRVVPYEAKHYAVYNKDFFVVKEIPNWCPMKNGFPY